MTKQERIDLAAAGRAATEADNARMINAFILLGRMEGHGYSVQLSTCRDTGLMSQTNGLPGWTVTIRGLRSRRRPSPKPFLGVRVSMLNMLDAIEWAYKGFVEQGGCDE